MKISNEMIKFKQFMEKEKRRMKTQTRSCALVLIKYTRLCSGCYEQSMCMVLYVISLLRSSLMQLWLFVSVSLVHFFLKLDLG